MLANLLRSAMQRKGWNKASILVRQSGLSQALISKLLAGHLVNITPETTDKLAQALGILPQDIFAASLADVRAQRVAEEMEQTAASAA